MDNKEINKHLPDPDKMGLEEIITSIENGVIQIPKFQRDFVWSLRSTAKLLDSILKGYPIGTFILWETNEGEGIDCVKKLGGKEFKKTVDENSKFVLDGQQRITSLYLARYAEKFTKSKGKPIPFEEIDVDLKPNLENADSDEDEEQIIAVRKNSDERTRYVKLIDVLDSGNPSKEQELKDSYPPARIEKIKKYRDIFYKYQFSVVTLKKDDVGSAIEVFTRLNTSGKSLSLFEIISAKTYNEEKDFDLQKKWDSFIEELNRNNYGDVSDIVALKVLAIITDQKKKTRECTRQTILDIKTSVVQENWSKVEELILECIRYFKNNYKVTHSSLLSYDALLVPFSYLFSKKKPDEINDSQRSHLHHFFWRVSLSERYSGATDSKLSQDITQSIDTILAGEEPKYSFDPVTSYEHIMNTDFNPATSYCKAVLCLLAAKQPRDFNHYSNLVDINMVLKPTDKKNDHHFFPKKHLSNKGVAAKRRNSLANITLISSKINQEIKSKSPKTYIEGFEANNKQMSETLESHFIGDKKEFGIETDDYELFLQKRAERISAGLEKLLNPDSSD